MDKDLAISLRNVKKTFSIPHEQINTFKSLFLMPFKWKKMKWNFFEALKEINLDVKKGEEHPGSFTFLYNDEGNKRCPYTII